MGYASSSSNGQKLQTSICHNASSFQWSHCFLCSGRIRGNICLVKQKWHTNNAAQRRSRGFLFKVFSCPKERRKQQTSHPGPACQHVSHEIRVSHAHTRNPDMHGAIGRLVHINRPEGHPYLSSTQELLKVRFSGHGAQVSSTSFGLWHICEMCWDS